VTGTFPSTPTYRALENWQQNGAMISGTHTNLDSKHAAVAKLEKFGDNLVTACTKMQQQSSWQLSPNAL
jgi:hypothetical protein